MTELALTWQALRPLPFDYNVFFQALRIDQDNQQSSRSPETPSTPLSSPGTTDQTLTIVRQLDRQPLDAAQPATHWQPGEIFTTTYVLDLAELPDDAALVYYFGYYDWRDGSRLPVNLGIDDKLIVYGH
jgi:hypothetical protein